MNSNVTKYTIHGLASIGLAVLNPKHAYRLRPDIWPTAGGCSCDFAEAAPKLPAYLAQRGAMLLRTMIDGRPVLVAAWSTADIHERLDWLGAAASTIEIADLDEIAPAPRETPQPTPVPAATDRRRERIEQLAAQEPPAHDCGKRTEILRARRELGMDLSLDRS